MPSIKCGNDIVYHDRLKSVLDNKDMMNRVFHPSEQVSDVKKLAGIFALKEAVIKALQIPSENWLNIEIRKKDNGKPIISLHDSVKPEALLSIDGSISHEQGLTSAIAMILLNEE